MNNDKYVFSVLASFLDRNHFNYLVRKYQGDRYIKSFSCWNQLLSMMFGQLCNREGLRDLVVALEAHQGKLPPRHGEKRDTKQPVKSQRKS